MATVQTQGLNPYHQKEEVIEQVISSELLPQLEQYVNLMLRGELKIIVYGAGCAHETACNRVRTALEKVLSVDDIIIHSDLLGAARALCGHEE